MVEIEKIVECLLENEVDFIVVGGVAAIAYGSAYVTKDLDICYSRSRENIKKLVASLAGLDPRLRGPGEEALDVPFRFDEKAIENGLNFTLITSLGSLDLLGELSGIGRYEDIVQSYQDKIQVGRFQCSAINLDGLIANKAAAGRPKDLVHLIELKALRKLKDSQE